MAKVECEIEEVTLEDEDGREVEGVTATCSECDHITESFGTGEKSVNKTSEESPSFSRGRNRVLFLMNSS